MSWACPTGGEPLEVGPDGLVCPGCGRVYPVVDGVPLFVTSDDERERVVRAAPELDRLWRAMDSQPTEEVLAAFCNEQGCDRSPYSTDWKFFFSVPDGGTTLELGAGIGDDSVDLAGRGGKTISLVPTVAHARVVGRRVRERSGFAWPVAVLTDATRLPLRDASVNAVALEDVAAPGFRLTNRQLPRAASEWKRVLAPGGVVFIGVANRLHALPGLERLRFAIRARHHPEALNRFAKRAGAPAGRPRLGMRRISRTMADLGFSGPAVYAPLPDENESHVVIPVEDADVVRYFLDNLIRKNSTLVRLALRLVHLSVTLSLFPWLVPYYYLIFRHEP